MKKNILIYAAIVLGFLALSYAFTPELLTGKIVNQSDISGWQGMTHEITEHNAAHPDDPTYWTNSMFGGMPTVTMYDKFEGDLTNPLYKFLLLGKRPATYLFIALLGAFLLLLSMGVDKWIAIGGAIAMAFCSYNIQIIQVGHNTKMQAIAFFPWVLAALIFTYKSARNPSKGERKWLLKTLLGAALFGLALSFQIKANHQQITWYLAACVFIFAIAELIFTLVKKERFLGFAAASGMLLAVGLIGIGTNANKLIPTYEYAAHTMRGGSELSSAGSSKGLELDYATAWSYGIDETPNLLIADFNGGASSGTLSEKSETAKVLKQYGYRGKNLRDMLSGLPLYWGPQPFTAGPMYMGAISIFLFILGLGLCKGREKWWMLAASIFALLLGYGSHAMWFTKLCYDTLPLYNKFRTVSMALIVLQTTLPLLGFVALDHIAKGEYEWKKLLKVGGIAYGITAGFCLVAALFPSIAGDFSCAVDSQLPKELVASLAKDRAALLRTDAIRSLIFITLAAGVILLALRSGNKKISSHRGLVIALGVGALVLVDLFSIDKRYLSDKDFVSPKDFSSQFEARAVDKMILEDPDPDYRVLDLSVNTFNDSHPSYHHKCIGGYSPAKMQRYQDLIDHYITGEMNSIISVVNDRQTVSGVEEDFPNTPILNMLNTKYVILQGNAPAVENYARYGNCWFVDTVAGVETADDEIAALGSTDLRSKAIVRSNAPEGLSSELCQKFSREKLQEGPDTDDIRLISYAPNELRYAYSCSRERVAVFSEIYYPGWVSDEVELFRADWTLRGAIIPKGEGEITLRFEPQSYKTGRNLSLANSILLLLLVIASLTTVLPNGILKQFQDDASSKN